ncbi:MAG: FAD-binding oxidoreductase [Methylocystis sp.]
MTEADARNSSDLVCRKNTIKSGDFDRRSLMIGGALVGGSAYAERLPGVGAAAARDQGRTIDATALRGQIRGSVATPDNADFDRLLFDGLWNRLHATDRLPQAIVRAQDEQDVCEAVRFARRKGLKVVVRGGGHNWCCPSLRRGGLLIDLGGLNKILSIDAAQRRATLQPIVSNREVQRRLNALGLSYPSGHCPQVKLSGYLLSGGMAWNQGVWGPGAGSVDAIDIVTAAGDLITASKDQNADYFWAARGAGYGLFGVAVRYHLKLYPLPRHFAASSYFYSLDKVGLIADWLGSIAGKLPANVELSLFLVTAPPALADRCQAQSGKVALVTATVFANSPEEAKSATALLAQGPIIGECLSKTENEHVDFDRLFDMSGALWPENRRNQGEAMFSDSNPKALFEAASAPFVQAPSPESVVLYAFFTGPNAPPLDAAFSMRAHMYGGLWTIWKDASDDDRNLGWHKKYLEILKPFAAGYYIGKTDAVSYPDHVRRAFATRADFRRIEELRKKHDPTGVFYNYFDGLG